MKQIFTHAILLLIISFQFDQTAQAIAFGDVPECLSLNTDADFYAQTYTQNLTQYNKEKKDNDPEYVPFNFTGYQNGFYIQLFASEGSTKECFFLVNKTSSVLYVDVQKTLQQPGVASAKIYSMKGPSCSVVNSASSNLVSMQKYYPTGGQNKDNCAYLIHFSLNETSGQPQSFAIQNFIVYYDYISTLSSSAIISNSVGVISAITMMLVTAQALF
eukprot:403339887